MEPLHRKNQRHRIRDPGLGMPDHPVTVDNVNNFIAHNLADYSTGTSSFGHWTTNPVNCIPWKSANDSMDQKPLLCGLQNLIQPGFRCSGSLSDHVDFSIGERINCSSNVNYGLKDSGVSQGTLFEVYSMAASSCARNAKNKSSPVVGMKQVDRELVTSPEQISSITACSNGDALSDAEAFDSGATHRDSFLQYTTSSSSENYSQLHCLNQGEYGGFMQTNQTTKYMDISPLPGESMNPYSNLWTPQENMKSINETSDSLPMIVGTPKSACANLVLSESQAPGSEHFGYHPYSQYDDQFNTQSNWSVVGADTYTNQTMVQGTSNVPKLASENSVYLSNHNVLNQYIMYKSMPDDMRRDVSFLQYMHLTVCNDHFCNCERYASLVSHFDICNTANCSICGPVHRPCRNNKRHLELQIRDNNFSGTIYGGDSNHTTTGTLADVLRPSKRLKNENLNIERLPRLEQWPETTVCSTDVSEVKKLLGPTEGFRITTGIAKDGIMSSTEDMVLNNVQSIANHQGPIELASSGDVMNSKVDDSVKLSSLDPTNDHYEESLQVGSEANQAKLEANCSVITPPVGNDSKLGFGETKIQGGTLADVFTESQLKEHLLSFSSSNHEEVKGEASSSDGQNTCQLCAKDKLVFGPAPLYCSACGNRIRRNLIYHSALDETGARLSFCTTCVKGSRGPNILFRGLFVSKAKLQKEKNNEEKEDSWVQCDRCQCWQHRVCGLYNDKRDAEGKAEYICPKCCLSEIQTGGRLGVSCTASFGAKNLPTTKLSDHLEQRLFPRLEQERVEMANHLGKNPEEVEVAEDLVIRVVVCEDKRLKAKQEFLDIFHEQDYPSEFEYKSKVIFLFQKIEGVDVCLFGMCVQEYGSECSGPNNRCVYISYLDSVKYFRPERPAVTGDSLRTFVYHEILVGYLEYCKKRGFTTCYIWACPLIKGEDYIFYCHPDTQKTPKQDKLRQWYKSMLKKAAKDGVVVDYTNLYDCFFVPTNTNKITAARLPYFEGDFWSGAAEDIVRKIEQESGSGGGLHRKLPTKRTLKAMGHDSPSTDATKDVLVMQKLGQLILPAKENFLLVHLHVTCTHCHEVILSGSRWFCNHCKKVQLCSRCVNTDQHLTDERKMQACNCGDKSILSEALVNDVPLHTKDEDIVLETSFFENREAFLGNCQKDNYQFDTLSHAKYSSMMILYNFTRKLNNKEETIGGACDTHELSRPSVLNLRDTERKLLDQALSIQDDLMHASQCKSKDCLRTMCVKLKRAFRHCNLCKVKVPGGCISCKKVWLILMEHSKICSDDSDCKVPRCMDLKNHRRAKQEVAIQSSENNNQLMAC